MKLYLTIIGIAVAIISAFNIAFGVETWHYIILTTLAHAVIQFALDGIIAILIRITPDRWYGIDSPYFDVTEREKSMYTRLGVRRWKDKVWELGGIGGFSKKTLAEPDNPEYIKKFIIECHKGVITHRLCYPIGFLAMLMLPGIEAFSIALPVALVNVFLNILPTIVLRYNTPKLKSVLARLNKKASAKEKSEAIAVS